MSSSRINGGSSPNLITISPHEYNETLRIIGLMKVPNLKDLARALGLIVGGKKSDLFDRIFTELERARTNHDFIAIAVVRILILKILQNSPLPRYSALHGALTAGVFAYSPVETTVPDALIPRGISIFKSPIPLLNSNGDSTTHSTSSSIRSHGNGAVRPSAALVRQETQPYKGHVLYFRESPFYRLKRMIHGAPQLAPPCPSRGTSSHKFILNDTETKLLFGDGSSPAPENVDCLILCGIGNPRTASTSSAYIQFPHPVELRVNGTLVKDGVKGIKNKLGTATPAKITNLIKKSPQLNHIEMVYLDTKEPYLFYCYIVENVSSEEILARVLSNRHIHYNATTSQIQKEYAGVDDDDDDDDDIIVATHSISLRDPVTRARMIHPCKSIFCEHIQCFDAFAFIQLQSQVPTWQCPICNKDVNVNDLAISDYYHEILRMTDSEVDNVSLLTDGSWEVIKEPEKNEDRERLVNGVSGALDMNLKSKEPEIEIISLDSESEDESDVASNEQQAQQDLTRSEQEQRDREHREKEEQDRHRGSQVGKDTSQGLQELNEHHRRIQQQGQRQQGGERLADPTTYQQYGQVYNKELGQNNGITISTDPLGLQQNTGQYTRMGNNNEVDNGNTDTLLSANTPLGLDWSVSGRNTLPHISESIRTLTGNTQQNSTFPLTSNQYVPDIYNVRQQYERQLISERQYQKQLELERARQEAAIQLARLRTDRNLYFGQLNNLQQTLLNQLSEQAKADYSQKQTGTKTQHELQKDSARKLALQQYQNTDQRSYSSENIHNPTNQLLIRSTQTPIIQTDVNANLPRMMSQVPGMADKYSVHAEAEPAQQNNSNILLPRIVEASRNTDYVEIISSEDEVENEQNGSGASAHQNGNIGIENSSTADINVQEVAHEIEMSLSGQLSANNGHGSIPDDEIPIGRFQDPNKGNSSDNLAQPILNPKVRRALDDDESSGSDLTPFEELPLSALNGFRQANNEDTSNIAESIGWNNISNEQNIQNSVETSSRNPIPPPPLSSKPLAVIRDNQIHGSNGMLQESVDTPQRYPTPPPPAISDLPIEDRGTDNTNESVINAVGDSVPETLPPITLPNSDNTGLTQGATGDVTLVLEGPISPVVVSVSADISSTHYDNPTAAPISMSEYQSTSKESQADSVVVSEQSSDASSATAFDKERMDRLRIEAERRRKENEDRRNLANEHYRTQNAIREQVRSHVMSYHNSYESNQANGKTTPPDVSINMEHGEDVSLQNYASNNPTNLVNTVVLDATSGSNTATARAKDDIVGVLGIAFTPTYLKDSFLEGDGSAASPNNVTNHDLYGRIGDMSLSSGKKKRTILPVPRLWNKRLNSTSAVQSEINDMASNEKSKD